MVTIKQVSELAGVSSATVSRVINNTDKVTEETRKQVLAAMEQLGYRPNFIAQSLASKKTNTVGYIVPELHGSFFGEMMSGSERELRGAGKHMFIAAGHSNEKDEIDAIEALLGRRCDALILHVEAVSDDYLISLADSNVPFVVVNRYIEEIGAHCIGLDNQQGGYLATKAVLAQGHREIAYLAGSLWKADARLRLAGHKKALAEFGVEYNPALFYEGDFQAHSGEAGIHQLLADGAKFTAVVCANDEMASGAIEALYANQIELPAQVSVVGFDNVNFAHYLRPKLTTVEYPMWDIGAMAARWILNKVYDCRATALNHVIQPKLIVRDSLVACKTSK